MFLVMENDLRMQIIYVSYFWFYNQLEQLDILCIHSLSWKTVANPSRIAKLKDNSKTTT